MKNVFALILTLFIISAISINAEENYKQIIIGKWEKICSKSDENGNCIKKPRTKLIMEFTENGKCIQMGQETGNYKIEGKTIKMSDKTMGNIDMEIIYMNDNEMLLKIIKFNVISKYKKVN